MKENSMGMNTHVGRRKSANAVALKKTMTQ